MCWLLLNHTGNNVGLLPQVMLAQQRTIIQLVELVNVLHDQAAKLVAALTRSSTSSGPGRLEEQQEQAEHQLAHERYILHIMPPRQLANASSWLVRCVAGRP